MSYNKITTYITLPVLAISAFAISVFAISPNVSATTSGGVSPPSSTDPAPKTEAQKKAAAEKAKAAADKAKADKEAKLAAAKTAAAKRKEMIGKSYSSCIEGMKGIDDISKLRSNIDKLITNRETKIAKLTKASDKLQGERKSQVQSLLASDQAVLDQISANSKTVDSASGLQKNYCEAIFKLQIYQFRARQISYINFVDKQIAAQSKLETAVDAATKSVQASNNLAKDEVLAQLASAKSTLRSGLEANGAAAFQIMGAKVEMVDGNYVNNLQKPADYGSKTMTAYQSALLDYTESVLTRKVANEFDKNLAPKLTISSITLKDKNGNKINVQRTIKDNPDTKKDESGTTISYKAKEARTAVVVVKANGGKEVTKTYTRDGPLQVWKVKNN